MPLKCETNLLQDPNEFEQFLRFIRKHNVKSYLEIGSKHGGSLWRVGRTLPKGSRIVSVDLPHGDTSFKDSKPNLEACISQLKSMGYDAHLFLGDSTDMNIVEKIKVLSPFDLIFIDANHTEPFVWKDWQNYGQMANLIAFHDIGFYREKLNTKKMPIDVPKVWKQIKEKYKHIEIRACPNDNGIGILWRDQLTPN